MHTSNSLSQLFHSGENLNFLLPSSSLKSQQILSLTFNSGGQVRCSGLTPVASAPGRLRQEDGCKFQASWTQVSTKRSYNFGIDLECIF